eukprot:2541202-Amphidinium_carterae.1
MALEYTQGGPERPTTTTKSDNNQDGVGLHRTGDAACCANDDDSDDANDDDNDAGCAELAASLSPQLQHSTL